MINQDIINIKEERLGIKKASDFLHISADTLRRLDRSGLLKAVRSQARGHRFYYRKDLESYLFNNLSAYTEKWVTAKHPFLPYQSIFCQDSSVFQGRLYRVLSDLDNNLGPSNNWSILVSVVGEIGDNTFGHNLGNFPDVAGLLFAYNLNKRLIVLADRGRGILETLRKVRPGIKDDAEALKVAFTEIISGRAPENRGNGLKWVRQNFERLPWGLTFRSGSAELLINKKDKRMLIRKNAKSFHGCLAIINF